MSRALASALAVGLLVGVPLLSAQTPDLVHRGKVLWGTRGCGDCHAFGRKTASGPDLAGVTQRRSRDWLRRFIKNPNSMFASDSAAKALLKQWHGFPMPGTNLSEEDLDALLAYVQAESKRKSS